MNLSEIMKQAQQAQDKMKEAQEKIAQLNVVGQSGAGLVQVAMNGRHDVSSVKLDASLFPADGASAEERQEAQEVLEDLIAASINNAVERIEKETKEQMSQVAGGMQMPAGFKMPF